MGCLTPCDIAAVNQERESWESLITSDRRYTRLSVASAFLAALFVHMMLREAITHLQASPKGHVLWPGAQVGQRSTIPLKSAC